MRNYLTEYQKRKQSSKVTIDNIRRILSSFFSWLEDEDYIIKSPIRRIHKVKTVSAIKETYTDENLEFMRDNCESICDLALIDMLSSTGMRVGELVLLNRKDINFEERECIVFGKGSKERMVYFGRENIRFMDKCGYDFIIMLKGIKSLVNESVLVAKDTFENDRYLHIYFSPVKCASERDLLEKKLDKRGHFLVKVKGQHVIIDKHMSIIIISNIIIKVKKMNALCVDFQRMILFYKSKNYVVISVF